MQTMRRRGWARNGPARLSSGGRASAMPAARRKCRRVMLMRLSSLVVGLLGLEEPALHDLVDQRPEAVLLLAVRADDRGDVRLVRSRRRPARGIGQQLLRQVPR